MNEIKKKLQSYKKSDIIFVKNNYKERLLKFRNFDESKLKNELIDLKNLQTIIPEKREYLGKIEIRYRCYFIYSNGKGRCFIIKFNKHLKIITVFSLGRKTLNKLRRKLRWRKNE
jgi:hypothetical protein